MFHGLNIFVSDQKIMWYDVFRVCFKPHVYATLLVCQLSLFSGFTKSYSAILTPALKDNSTFVITTDEISWLASYGTLLRPLGSFIQGAIVDKFGRKTCVQLAVTLQAASWILIGFSHNYLSLSIGRLSSSLASGMEGAISLYISEISPVSDRGTLLSLIAPATACGTLSVFLLGVFLYWRMIAFVFGAYALAVLALLFFIYDSPIWYMLTNDKRTAVESLMWLRNDNRSQMSEEIEEIEQKLSATRSNSVLEYLKNFTHREVWRPFVLFAIFSVLQNCTGESTINAYAKDFFKLFSTEFDKNLNLPVIFAAISLAGSLNVVLVSRKIDRTQILLISGLSMGVSLLVAATSFNFGNSQITIIFIFVYIYCCMSGMTSVPFMIMAEIFPSHVKGVMVAAVSMFMNLPATVNTKLYPTMVTNLHPSGILVFFATFSIAAGIFPRIFIPETRNKSLFEINEYFRRPTSTLS